jgi:hypothetical protein
MKIFITPLDDKSRQTDMIKLGRTSKFYGNDAALNAAVFLIQKYHVPLDEVAQKIADNSPLDDELAQRIRDLFKTSQVNEGALPL